MISCVLGRRMVLAAAALAAGCDGAARVDRGPAAVPNPPSRTETFQMRGVVREVDPAQKAVTIAHEAMPGFMGEMTMPFTIEKPGALDDVQVGDEVEGPIRVEFEGDKVRAYRLEDLLVANPAPATLKLGVGPNGATLGGRKETLRPGDPVPDFAMTDQDGRPLRLSDLRGKIVVLTFIYTRCPLPDFCPASDVAFGELARLLGEVKTRADRVRLLSVSFDPEHDTPEVLRSHAKRRGAEPPLWRFAVAPHEELRKVAEPLGLTYGPTKNEIVHNLSTAVIDPEGRLVRLDLGKAGSAWTAAELAKTATELSRVSTK